MQRFRPPRVLCLALTTAALVAPVQGASQDEATLRRVEATFQQVLRVFPELIDPRLRIEDTGRGPFGRALADGEIVINEPAVRLCFDGVSTAQGNARLAFVLAHEMVHLAHRDFFHALVFEAIESFSGSTEEKLSATEPLQAGGRDRELEADREGLIRMAQAGYDPLLLLQGSRAFLEAWERQSVRRFAGRTAGKRALLLEVHVEQVANQLPLFEAGIRLYQGGFYDQALPLLVDFERVFSESAVLNALGLTHYQLAARHLASCDGSLVVRFLLPTLLDTDTIAQRFVPRGEKDCYRDPGFKRHRIAAEKAFDRALGIQPDYLPAHLNWASLLLLAGEGIGVLARASELDEAQVGGENVRLLEILGIYLRGYGTAYQQTEHCIKELGKQLQAHPESPEITYAQARLLQESGQSAEAEWHWRRFLELQSSGVHADHVRQQLEVADSVADLRAVELPVPPTPLGPVSERAERWLGTLESARKLQGSGWKASWHQGRGYRALVLDEILIWVEEPLAQPVSLEELSRTLGPPHRMVMTADGRFASWGGVGFHLLGGMARSRAHFAAKR